MAHRSIQITIGLLAVICLVLISQDVGAQQPTAGASYHQWWRDRPFGRPYRSPQAKALPLIQVKGNKFVDPEGKTVLFRGLSISDPGKIEHQGLSRS